MWIHFYECWDESILLGDDEAREWLDEIQAVINGVDLTLQEKLQKIVDMVCSDG